ncbi:MAG: hypothetical protein JXD19_08625 [Deltaproteobacteria bacterium]|nr:hypothetical protein [Deltaproteobacteria bacterium]
MNNSESSGVDSQGRRMLAAVMFTDVVDSSRLMGENEERTMILIERDLRIICELCKQFNGRVLKQMGDGCLAVFQSGVYAVECAQEVQRLFAEHARSLPPEEVLQHRIGIHLGDIYVTDDEVMGDGVNVAARLQTEAPAGGICISQPLYEVIKTRLSMQTVYLGAKQLKNIRSPVHIYHVKIPMEAEFYGLPQTAPPPSGRRQYNQILWGFALCTLFLAGIVAFLLLKKPPLSGDKGAVEPTLSPPGPTAGIPAPARVAPVSPQSSAPLDAPKQSPPKDGLREPLLTPIEVFRRLDRNGDGRLARNEVPMRLWRRIIRADRDRDGCVTVPELKALQEVFDELRKAGNEKAG